MSSTALLIGAVGLQMMSASQQASAARQQGRAVAASEETNARLAEQDAHNTIVASRVEQERIRRESQKKRGEIISQVAASGFITTDEGPLNLLAQNAANEEREELRTQFEGEVKASRFLTEAGLSRQKGASAVEGAKLSAAGSLLGGTAGALSLIGSAK